MVTLAGKKAVITGGTIGVGMAIARQLRDAGAEVLLTGRNERNLAFARDALGAGVHVLRSDTASLNEIRALREQVQQRLGAIDALFINAGVATLTAFADVSEQEYDLTFAINTRGAFFSVQQLAPLLRDGAGLVFTTSIANRTGYPGMSVYAASKAALRALSQGFAAELLPRGIRVNALSPGFVKTPTMGIAEASPDALRAFEQEGERVTPMRRMATADEVARAALFLAFEATFTTGVELLIDGGMTGLSIPHPDKP